MVPSISITRPTDFLSIREELLPLPSAEQGYRSVLLLGTTGAGKTGRLVYQREEIRRPVTGHFRPHRRPCPEEGVDIPLESDQDQRCDRAS